MRSRACPTCTLNCPRQVFHVTLARRGRSLWPGRNLLSCTIAPHSEDVVSDSLRRSVPFICCVTRPHGHHSAGYAGRHPVDIRENIALPNANHSPAQRIELAPHAAVTSHVRLNLPNPVLAVVALCEPHDPVCEFSAMPEVAIGKDRYFLATENEVWAPGKLGAICSEPKP